VGLADIFDQGEELNLQLDALTLACFLIDKSQDQQKAGK